jgi:hypothetical protein
VANPIWTAPQVKEDTILVLRVRISDGRGGSVSRLVPVVVLVGVPGPASTATSRGCTFTITAENQVIPGPPHYIYIVTRQASALCPYASDRRILGSSYAGTSAITGNNLGIAVAYTIKNTVSGSSPTSVRIEHLAPDTLGSVSSGLLTCGPSHHGDVTIEHAVPLSGRFCRLRKNEVRCVRLREVWRQA